MITGEIGTAIRRLRRLLREVDHTEAAAQQRLAELVSNDGSTSEVEEQQDSIKECCYEREEWGQCLARYESLAAEWQGTQY